MKITFLGTNGWYTSKTGNTPCIVIDSKDYYVVLDAGNGLCFLDSVIKEDKPIFLFISHFHIDHISGLHTLNKFNFKQGLTICFAKGREKDFRTFVSPPYTIGIEQLSMKINLIELVENNNPLPFPVECIELFHTYRGHGYRIELDGKIISYSGDAGINESSKKLAEKADLLIHECSYQAIHPKDTWGHAGPIETAQLAKDADVKQLILTHFDATQYKTPEDRKNAEKQAKKIFSNTIAAFDGFCFNLS